MSEPISATIGLSVIDTADVMHVRGWHVPLEIAEEFAAAMTIMFGEPDEVISTAEATESAERAAEQGTLYLLKSDKDPDR